MEWDQDIFVKKILELVKDKCEGVQNTFNDKIGRDSVSRWKGGARPSLDVLLKITEEFGCSLDWLLGEEAQVHHIHPEALDLCDDINSIFESADDEAKATLRAAVKDTHNKLLKKQNLELKKKVRHAEKITSKGQASSTTKAGSIG